MALRVLIAGSSGLVGSKLLEQCLEHREIAAVKTVGRSPGMLQHTKLNEYLVDFDHESPFVGLDCPDAVFCCLGTTLAKAGSQEAFKKVDHDYVLALAKWAREAGCPAFHLVSAVGADAASPIFYSRVKGQVELAVKALNFRSTVIYQPSLLIGPRKDRRIGEAIAQRTLPLFSPLLLGRLAHYKPITAKQLATTMLHQALKPLQGVHTLLGQDLFSS
ncbi:MAG: NAD-dependent epimerase/dehydratase family protein [Bacteroidetes bacterium]|nr:NAD-dependent epimerase/dehydratase family protein [Bacteroidota bacterium]